MPQAADHPRIGRVVTILGLAATVVACDVPTDAPSWTTRWIVPSEESTVEVDEFLPDNVTINSAGTAFLVDVDPFSFQETLGGLCAACAAQDGQTVPKPDFSATLSESTDLGDDVDGVTVSSGTVRIVARNGFDFPILRPAAGVFGTLTFRLYDGDPATGRLIDEETFRGETDTFGPNQTLTAILALNGEVGNTLTAVLDVVSPQGDPVNIQASDLITIEATPMNIEVSSARVSVAGEDISFDPTELDVADIEEDIAQRVEGGALRLHVENPFGVAADLVLRIEGSGFETVTKSLTVPASATSNPVVQFTAEELRRFLGQAGVTLRADGTVAGSAGTITVTPGQVMLIESDFDISIRIGSED